MCLSVTETRKTVKGRNDGSQDITTESATESPDYNQWLHAMKMVARLPGGMPPEFRRKLWLALSEKYLKTKNVDWEAEELKCFSEQWREDDEELGIQIVKDLHRTGSSLCSGPAGTINQAKLKRILLGYARYNPEVGYCQGFNMLGALILQVMDKEEIESIKVMIYLVEGILPKGYFSGSMGGLQADMAVFRELMTDKFPRLAKHLQKLQGPVENAFEPPLTNVFTMQWFLTMFCTCLPMTCVLRVWDLVLIEGSDVLLRTALVLWSLLEDRILNAKTADEFYCKMGSFSSELVNGHLIDSNGLIEKVVDIGHIPNLQALRDKHLYNISSFRDKKRLQLYYSDDECDSDEDSRMAVATAWGIRLSRRGSAGLPDKPDNKDRLALDISLLKKQYDRLRERQRQAHIILTSAVARQSSSSNQSSISVNQLLYGRNAIVTKNGRRLGPPHGAIPPIRKLSYFGDKSKATQSKTPSHSDSSKANEAHLPKRRKENNELSDSKSIRSHSRNDRTVQKVESGCSSRSNSSEPRSAKASVEERPCSDSSSYSEEIDEDSSTSTSLCDEDGIEAGDANLSSIEGSPLKRMKSSEEQPEIPLDQYSTLPSISQENITNNQISYLESNSGSALSEYNKHANKFEASEPSCADCFDEYRISDFKEPTTESISDKHVEDNSLNSKNLSSAYLSKLSGLTSLPEDVAVNPLLDTNQTVDFMNLVMNVDDLNKLDVKDEGVTNEYFERVNIVERPNKLKLLYSLNEEESIRNAFKWVPDNTLDQMTADSEPRKRQPFSLSPEYLNYEEENKFPHRSTEDLDKQMKILIEYSNKSSLLFIAEAKQEISSALLEDKKLDRRTKEYSPTKNQHSPTTKFPQYLQTSNLTHLNENVEDTCNDDLDPKDAIQRSSYLDEEFVIKNEAEEFSSPHSIKLHEDTNIGKELQSPSAIPLAGNLSSDNNSKFDFIQQPEKSCNFENAKVRTKTQALIDSCDIQEPTRPKHDLKTFSIMPPNLQDSSSTPADVIMAETRNNIPSTEDLETRYNALELTFNAAISQDPTVFLEKACLQHQTGLKSPCDQMTTQEVEDDLHRDTKAAFANYDNDDSKYEPTYTELRDTRSTTKFHWNQQTDPESLLITDYKTFDEGLIEKSSQIGSLERDDTQKHLTSLMLHGTIKTNFQDSHTKSAFEQIGTFSPNPKNVGNSFAVSPAKRPISDRNTLNTISIGISPTKTDHVYLDLGKNIGQSTRSHGNDKISDIITSQVELTTKGYNLNDTIENDTLDRSSKKESEASKNIIPSRDVCEKADSDPRTFISESEMQVSENSDLRNLVDPLRDVMTSKQVNLGVNSTTIKTIDHFLKSEFEIFGLEGNTVKTESDVENSHHPAFNPSNFRRTSATRFISDTNSQDDDVKRQDVSQNDYKLNEHIDSTPNCNLTLDHGVTNFSERHDFTEKSPTAYHATMSTFFDPILDQPSLKSKPHLDHSTLISKLSDLNQKLDFPRKTTSYYVDDFTTMADVSKRSQFDRAPWCVDTSETTSFVQEEDFPGDKKQPTISSDLEFPTKSAVHSKELKCSQEKKGTNPSFYESEFGGNQTKEKDKLDEIQASTSNFLETLSKSIHEEVSPDPNIYQTSSELLYERNLLKSLAVHETSEEILSNSTKHDSILNTVKTENTPVPSSTPKPDPTKPQEPVSNNSFLLSFESSQADRLQISVPKKETQTDDPSDNKHIMDYSITNIPYTCTKTAQLESLPNAKSVCAVAESKLGITSKSISREPLKSEHFCDHRKMHSVDISDESFQHSESSQIKHILSPKQTHHFRNDDATATQIISYETSHQETILSPIKILHGGEFSPVKDSSKAMNIHQTGRGSPQFDNILSRITIPYSQHRIEDPYAESASLPMSFHQSALEDLLSPIKNHQTTEHGLSKSTETLLNTIKMDQINDDISQPHKLSYSMINQWTAHEDLLSPVKTHHTSLESSPIDNSSSPAIYEPEISQISSSIKIQHIPSGSSQIDSLSEPEKLHKTASIVSNILESQSSNLTSPLGSSDINHISSEEDESFGISQRKPGTLKSNIEQTKPQISQPKSPNERQSRTHLGNMPHPTKLASNYPTNTPQVTPYPPTDVTKPSTAEEKSPPVRPIPTTADLEYRFRELEKKFNKTYVKTETKKGSATISSTETSQITNMQSLSTADSYKTCDESSSIRKRLPSTEDLENRFVALEINKTMKSPTLMYSNPLFSTKLDSDLQKDTSNGSGRIPSTKDLEHRFQALERGKTGALSSKDSKQQHKIKPNSDNKKALKTSSELLECENKKHTNSIITNQDFENPDITRKPRQPNVFSPLRSDYDFQLSKQSGSHKTAKFNEIEIKDGKSEKPEPRKRLITSKTILIDPISFAISDLKSDRRLEYDDTKRWTDKDDKSTSSQIQFEEGSSRPAKSTTDTSTQLIKYNQPQNKEMLTKLSEIYNELGTKTDQHHISWSEYDSPVDSSYGATDRVLKIIEENSKILHQILKKNLTDTTDSDTKIQLRRPHPPIRDSLLTFSTISPHPNDSKSLSHVSSRPWIQSHKTLPSDDNISDRLASIKNTIKSIDTLCAEKYINSLFTHSVLAKPGVTVEDDVSDHILLQRTTKRDFKKDTSPRRRRDDDTEEYKSRLKRDTIRNWIQTPTDTCLPVGNTTQVDRTANNDTASSENYASIQNCGNNRIHNKSGTPMVYIPTKLEIRHTTVTSTMYDRYLTEKQIEKSLPKNKRSTMPPISLTPAATYGGDSMDRNSKSAENSPSRRTGPTTVLCSGKTKFSNHKLHPDVARRNLQIRSCDNILLQIESSKVCKNDNLVVNTHMSKNDETAKPGS